MASVDDIRLTVAWRDHPKRAKLHRRLGAEGVLAVIDLWCWAGANRPDGILLGMDEEDVEIAARWSGPAGALTRALVELRLLDCGEGGILELHDWHEHQPWAVGADARADASRKAATEKWRRRNEAKGNAAHKDDAPRMGSALRIDAGRTDPHCPSPSPIPSPTPIPSPIPTPIGVHAPARDPGTPTPDTAAAGGEAVGAEHTGMGGVKGGDRTASPPSPDMDPPPPRRTSEGHRRDIPGTRPTDWNAGAFEALWTEIRRQRPGAPHEWGKLAERLAADAELLEPPQAPEVYAWAMIAALAPLAEHKAKAGERAPPLSVPGFRGWYEELAAWVARGGPPAAAPAKQGRIIGPAEPSDFSDCPAEGRDALANWNG